MEEDGFSQDLRRFSEAITSRPVGHLVRDAVKDLVRAWIQARNYAHDELKLGVQGVVIECRIEAVAERVWQELTDKRYSELVASSCIREVRRRWGARAALELAAVMESFYEVRDAALALTSTSEADRSLEIALMAGRDDGYEKGMRDAWKRLDAELTDRPTRSDR
ncbi:hypothetical protein [Stenotrophomonas maltophilia]|uniref:hypothetical protein n=1 Tax=Stenotrophomonas maltophilia TaxID=40324 RepID=UPI001FA70B35|nr:hypothetical protein [Stenotrophomonas maltophilia]